MSLRLKIVLISFVSFFIILLSIGVVFALSKEEFNLSGNLSYSPNYEEYVLIDWDRLAGSGYAKVYETGKVEAEVIIPFMAQPGGANKNCSVYYNITGQLDGEMIRYANVVGGYSSFFDKENELFVELAAGGFDGKGFLYENFLVFMDMAFVKAGTDLNEIVFIGSLRTREALGFDLALPIQTSNLPGQELKNKLLGLDAGQIVVYNGYSNEYVDFSSLEFGEFDQTSSGLKSVQVTFQNPFKTDEKISGEILVYVYEEEAEITYYRLTTGMPGPSNEEIVLKANATVDDLVATLNSITFNLGYFERSLVEVGSANPDELISNFTADMISDFVIGENGGSFYVTYKKSSILCFFSTVQADQEYILDANAQSLFMNMLAWEKNQIGVDPLASIYATSISDRSQRLPREDLKIEYYLNGALTSFDKIVSSAGIKKYQIKVSLENGEQIKTVNMTTFVWDETFRIPTEFYDGFETEVAVLEDGSLDVGDGFVRICYNGKNVQIGSEDEFVEGVDYEDIYLTDDRVEIRFAKKDNTAEIYAILVDLDFNGEIYKVPVYEPKR